MALSFSSAATPHHQQQTLILQSLSSCKSMQYLKQIHCLILKSQPLQTPLILSKLLSFSSLSPRGDIAYAFLLLSHPFNTTTITTSMYNVLLRGISLHSKFDPMLIYQNLLLCGLYPNNFTFPPLISSLMECRAFSEGKLIHAHVVKMGFEFDAYVRNGLLGLYSVCGEMGFAHNLFDRFPDRDLVSWTSLISGYSKLGFAEEAAALFVDMMDAGLVPDAVLMTTVLSACSRIRNLELGRNLHRYVDSSDHVHFDVFVGNALVDMYSKCGDVESAYGVFKKMHGKNVVSWNSMISGLVQNGEFKEALSLFRQMQKQGLEPDAMTLVGVLSSCANLGALELGQWVHFYIDKVGIREDGIVGNALVDMYAKCGKIEQATGVFNAMMKRDVYTYTSMIVGLAMHGRAKEALHIYTEMLRGHSKPNGVTFIGVLMACSHAGFVDMGLGLFHDMRNVYGIAPQIEHYGCVVDMLGRGGLLDKAMEFINKMPVEPDALIWGSLLGACRIHGNVMLSEGIAKKLLELEPDEDAGYVLMTNIYANSNQRVDEKHIRNAMKRKNVKKTPGCSLIEVDGILHEFRMRDKSHPRKREIYAIAEEIYGHLRGKGSSAFAVEISEQALHCDGCVT